MTDGPRRVVVVGAGITGLAAAHRLTHPVEVDGPPSEVGVDVDVEVVVVEAGDVAGGKIRSSPIAGVVVDEAADAFLARVPEATALARELGLGEKLVSPAERRAFVYRHGALHRFPERLVLGVPTDLDLLASTGLVSPDGLARAADDLTMPADVPGAPPAGADESVGALVRRRVGDEIFEAFVGPLLSGVNAGDADELSVEAGAPQFAAAVRDQPSLIRGLQRQLAAANPDAPVFHGLRDGTQSLVTALVDALPAGALRTGVAARSVETASTRALAVHTDAGVLEADAVVVATPTHATAALVDRLVPEVADGLRALDWSSVVLVTFAARRADIDHALDGSGFLVSEGEGLLLTACSFGSSKWAHWRPPASAGDEIVILRASAGRHQDPRAWALPDDELLARLRDELTTTIGWRGEPVAARVSRWRDALPQYRPGHLERARAWKDDAAAAAPGLVLAGAGYFGLGIPACIRDGEDAARRVAERLFW